MSRSHVNSTARTRPIPRSRASPWNYRYENDQLHITRTASSEIQKWVADYAIGSGHHALTYVSMMDHTIPLVPRASAHLLPSPGWQERSRHHARSRLQAGTAVAHAQGWRDPAADCPRVFPLPRHSACRRRRRAAIRREYDDPQRLVRALPRAGESTCRRRAARRARNPIWPSRLAPITTRPRSS